MLFVNGTICPLNTSFSRELCILKNVSILSVIARYRHFRGLASLYSKTLVVMYRYCQKFSQL